MSRIYEILNSHKKLSLTTYLFIINLTIAIFNTLFYPPQDIFLKNGFFLDNRIIDLYLFAPAGESIITGDLNNTYADKSNQAGPLQLVFSFFLGKTGEVNLLSSWYIQSIFVQFILMLTLTSLILILSNKVLFKTHNFGLQRLILLTPLMLGLYLSIISYSINFYVFGHYWQIAVVLLWSATGFFIAKKKAIPAGIMLALSIALEPWGIFGFILLLLSNNMRDFIKSVLVGMVGGVLAWAPFALQKDFSMGDYKWVIRPGTFWSLIAETESSFSWSHRISQGFLVLTVSLFLVFFSKSIIKRNSQNSSLLFVFSMIISSGIILARVCFDPTYIRYYLYAPQVMLLIAGIVLLFNSNFKMGLPILFVALALITSYNYGPLVSFFALIIIFFSISFERKNTMAIL